MRIEEGRIPRRDDFPQGSPSAKASPVRIASPSPARFSRSASRSRTKTTNDGQEEKLDFEQVRKVSERNRRKKKEALLPAAPAMVTVRGFQTPGSSGGEESDFSRTTTPRLGPKTGDLPSVTSSPALRPTSSQGGISALRQQFGSLNLDTGSFRSTPIRMASGLRSDFSGSDNSSDSDKVDYIPSESYEVNLEHDFISRTLGSNTPTSPASEGTDSRADTLTRKMTAEDFEPIKCLGKGSFGTVLLVRHRATGRLFAQKQLRKATLKVQASQEQAKTERQILESVNRHPFVVKLYYAFQDQEKLYLILQYAEGGELFYHLAMEHIFNEEHAAFYMAELVLALEHLHRTVGVVYRDLKPENILLDSEGHVLLTDFGLSKVAVDEDDTCKSFVGTFEYMAPEVIKGEEYGMAVDWWSLGALGVELMTGNSPFTANNKSKIEENILKKKFVPPYYLSPDAKDLLIRLLRKKPKDRLGSNMPKDLTTIKKHRFFRKIDWKKLQRREVDPPFRPMITDPSLAENFSKEFTDLMLSPTGALMERRFSFENVNVGDEMMTDVNPFGGFSYTASSSLLESGVWAL
ncbi:Pkinase-domain-containing protein [Rhizodiscina lignyota]|uniref:Pkinase-domain-containing protein n=1 Tax=Rhizodiscina lignyota TaxID=1504668 RepID=A0A9P4I8T1_9PEZI|nr:Pkinase-domain-containing protein [Rhizodiscina lignyota]